MLSDCSAFQMGHDRVAVWTEPVNTMAVSIADRLAGYPEDGTYTLSLVRKTAGRVAAVSDEEMRSARAALLQYDGLDVELSGAAGIAWLRREPLEGNVICILTASGFKHTYKGDLPLLDEDESRRAAAEAIAGLISSAGIDATIVQQTDVRFDGRGSLGATASITPIRPHVS
jgi:threonine synthase